MSKVSDRDSVLLFDVGEEGSLVVDFEVEDSVLIWELEACGVDGGAWGSSQKLEGQAVEGRKHREFELELVAGYGDERLPGVPRVLGKLNFVGLYG